MSYADMALYGAKESGRGLVCFFDNEMHKNIQQAESVERDLRKAISAGELEMFYQPQFSLKTGRFVGSSKNPERFPTA